MMKVFFRYPKILFCPVQVPLETGFLLYLALSFPLPHTLFQLVFEEGSIEVGKSCPLKMYSDFHIN